MGSFHPAVMDGVGLFVTLGGSSTSGKTKSALRLAKGLAGDKKIAAIDTEGKRMSHYSAEFDFDVVNMRSPFGGKRFAGLAKEAEDAGYGALVIDSFSLEWSGVGGVLEMRDELFAAAGFAQKFSDQCWARAKADHKRMANEFLQITMPIIFCVRANRVPGHLCKGGDKGPVATNPAGAWKIEQDKKFIYDWTVGFVLHPETPGKPRYDMVDFEGNRIWKCNPEHRPFFPAGEFITEDAGVALRKWRFGEEARRAGSKAVGDIAGAALAEDDQESTESPPTLPDALQKRVNRAKEMLAEAAGKSEVAEVETKSAKLIADLTAADFADAASSLTAAIQAAKTHLETV